MHLVHDGLGRPPLQRCVAFPIIRLHIYDHALHGGCGIVAGLPCRVATVVCWNNSAAPVRIQEDFAWIETHSTRRIERAFNSITVDLPWLYPRYKDVPIMIGPVSCRIDRDHTRRLSILDAMKKKEFDCCCVFWVNAKIRSPAENSCS